MNDRASELAKRLVRNFNDAPLQHEKRPPLYDTRTAALAAGTAARNLGASIDTVEPGMRACPYHFHHAREEMFVVVEGEGTLRVAGEMLPLRAGDVVFIPPGREFPHQIINTSGAPLRYLSISTMEMPEVCEYPDSGKFLATAGSDGKREITAIQRVANNLDYWDGE